MAGAVSAGARSSAFSICGRQESYQIVPDCAVAVINGNYALQAGLHAADALAIEDASGDAAQTYANIIACRAGEENSAKIQALVKALQSDAVKEYIEKTYNGAVVAIF